MPLRLLLATAMIGLLAGCGGPVAPDAPALLSRAEVDAAIVEASQTSVGAQATSDLALRAASLRARSAGIRRSDLTEAERRRLLRRAQELNER